MKNEFEKLKVKRVYIKQPCDICGNLPEDNWYILNPVYDMSGYMCPKCFTEKCRSPEDWIEMEKEWCIVEYKTTISRLLRKKDEQTRFVISSLVKRRKKTFLGVKK